MKSVLSSYITFELRRDIMQFRLVSNLLCVMFLMKRPLPEARVFECFVPSWQNCFEKDFAVWFRRRYGTKNGLWGLKCSCQAQFYPRHPTASNLWRGWKLSGNIPAVGLPICCPASCHDGHGQILWNYQQTPTEFFFI